MLPKAHLTLHSRISGSWWVTTPLWLSGSGRSFLHSSSVYSCHLFLISSASVRSIPFLSFIEPIFAWNVPLVSLIFLKKSLVFPILFFPSISLHWSLRKAFLSLLAILWNSAFRWIYLSFSPLPFWASAAAAKLLQSCPTLCDPIDDSLPGSSVPGIYQARILEWVAISFSNLSIYYVPNNILNTLQMATH